MKKAIFSIILLLLCAGPSFAQYNIHLKNGSVIRGVASYEEVDGEIRFKYMGGTVGIPLENIQRVEKAAKGDVEIAPPAGPGMRERSHPVVPPTQMPAAETPSQTGPLKQRLADLNGRQAQIEAKEAEYNTLKEEYDLVRLRIEVLFQKGVAEAKRKGGDPAKWFQFLPEQERQWAQLNTLKKNDLQKQVKTKEVELAPLLQEKKALLEEKQKIESDIKQMESPY